MFASEEAVDALRMAFHAVRSHRPFEVEAMVVLPDHLHRICSLPEGDADFATCWRLIKTWFTKHYDPALRTAPNQNPLERHRSVFVSLTFRCSNLHLKTARPAFSAILSQH